MGWERPDRGRFFEREIHELLYGEEQMTCDSWQDSNRQNGVRLHGAIGNHAPEDGAGVPAVSFNGDRDGLFQDGLVPVGAVSNGFISLQDQDQCFTEISFSFGKRAALGVDARNFLDISQVPLASLHIHSSELANHCNCSLPEDGWIVNGAEG